MSSAIDPADQAKVRSAARLGWSLAELRGRLRPAVIPTEARHRAENALPLGAERSNREKSIEVEAAVAALAASLNVDLGIDKLSGQPTHPACLASERLRTLSQELAAAQAGTSSEPLGAAWREVTNFFYAWDAAIQDSFAAEPHQSAAYQFGRGVAETRWALYQEITEDSDWRSWGFLLGSVRGQILDGLLARLADYYDPTTRHALSSSLGRWQALVLVGSNMSAPDTMAALKSQAFIWRDLIVGDRNGTGLVAPSDVLRKPGNFAPVLMHLWPEALVLGSSSLLLLFAAFLLSSSGNQTVGAVIGVLGILGVSGAALATRARAAAIGLLSQIHDQLYFDLAAEKAFVGPRSSSRAR